MRSTQGSGEVSGSVGLCQVGWGVLTGEGVGGATEDTEEIRRWSVGKGLIPFDILWLVSKLRLRKRGGGG